MSIKSCQYRPLVNIRVELVLFGHAMIGQLNIAMSVEDTDTRVRNSSMDPTCFVSTVQAGRYVVMVWGMVS